MKAVRGKWYFSITALYHITDCVQHVPSLRSYQEQSRGLDILLTLEPFSRYFALDVKWNGWQILHSNNCAKRNPYISNNLALTCYPT